MRLCLTLTCLAALAPVLTVAQQFNGMAHDQFVNLAVYDMQNTFGYVCETLNDQNACNALTYVQRMAVHMTGASDACLQGNRQGCEAYEGARKELDAVYRSFSKTVYGSDVPNLTGEVPIYHPDYPDYYSGAALDDLMAGVARFGAASAERFATLLAALEASAVQFGDGTTP